MTKSRTIKWMIVMAALEGAAASLHYWQGIIPVEVFAGVSTVISLSTSMLAVYMRTITTLPLSERK